jgi:hypothetical protein
MQSLELGTVDCLQGIRDDLVRGSHKPHRATPAYTTVVNSARKYVEVSESFYKLVSYEADELIGTRYDHLTAPETADVPTANLLTRFRYIHGFGCCCIAAVSESNSV